MWGVLRCSKGGFTLISFVKVRCGVCQWSLCVSNWHRQAAPFQNREMIVFTTDAGGTEPSRNSCVSVLSVLCEALVGVVAKSETDLVEWRGRNGEGVGFHAEERLPCAQVFPYSAAKVRRAVEIHL